ncbi:MAG: AAA family ATPase [Gammaproteobacteria bacterium]|nr:AAA family ATPase [Gammaproteobacteria bacterium]
MQKYYDRKLDLQLPAKQSAFLWGPRQCGKSTYLRRKFNQSIYIDLLDFDQRDRFSVRPTALGEMLQARPLEKLGHPVVIDEVQNAPNLLDEVHRLIENKHYSFVLCGSSARKLKIPGINLLGGRAWRFHMYPLTIGEIKEFDLLTGLNCGLLPAVYGRQNFRRNLDAYVNNYLETEIYNEAYIRNAQSFSRFFKSMRFFHGEILNYSSISRDCGVSNHTVRTYVEILEDTLVGYLVFPFRKPSKRRTISSKPKFYLFDVGLANFVCGRTLDHRSTTEFGKSFEHLILTELWAARSYLEKDFDIAFWRTSSGLEVDFVLGDGQVAVEVKSRVRSRDLRGIKAFIEEHNPKSAIVVTAEDDRRRIGSVDIMPYREFVSLLNDGTLI